MNRQISLFSFLTALCMFAFAIVVIAQKSPGYTLYSVQNGTTASLIDTNNNVYHTWTFSSSAKTGYSSYLLKGGSIMRTVARSGNSFTGGPICGEVQTVDWNGNVVWDYVYSTTAYCTHHDICPMPNGNVLLIAYETRTAAEVTQAGGSSSIVMWPDKIVEIQPSGATGGNVVWEWHAWDHLVQNVNAAKDNYATSISDHPELLNINYNQSKDWMHMNGVDYNARLDQITFSCHNLNEIYVIDHSTTTAQAAGHTGGNSGKGGDLLFRWGNPAAYGLGTTANKILNVVHDAHWVDEGYPRGGYLAMFNNNGVSSTKSAVDLIAPPVSGYNYTRAAGAAFTPATSTVRHACNGYTSNMGGSQQFPNGNMMVTIALSGYMYEVDSNNTVVWSKSAGGTVAKAYRYTACYIAGTQPATPSVTSTGNVLTSSVTGTSYQWYLNGIAISGATSVSYTATQAGAYTVAVLDAGGCTSERSAAYTYTPSGVNQVSGSADVHIYPNPSSGVVMISTAASLTKDYTVLVSDAFGRIIINAKNTKRIDLGNQPAGIYHVVIKGEQINTTQKITLSR